MTERAKSRLMVHSVKVLAAVAVCASVFAAFLAHEPSVMAPAAQAVGEPVPEVSPADAFRVPDEVTRVAAVPLAGAAGRVTGRLLMGDARVPVVGCPYGTLVDPAATPFSQQVLGITGKGGEWSIDTASHARTLRVAFLLEPYCRVVFCIPSHLVPDGDLSLEVPRMGRCEVSILAPGVARDIAWNCNIELCDPRSPGESVSTSRRTWTSTASLGECIVQIEGSKAEGLGTSSVTSFLAPIGTELIVGAWSATHDLGPTMVRAIVPTSVQLPAAPKVLGAWLHYHPSRSDEGVEPLVVHALRPGKRGGSWVPLQMDGGHLFIPQERIARDAPLRVELCAADGEFFTAILTPSGQSLTEIDWRQGSGVAPTEMKMPEGSEVVAVWCEGDGGTLSPLDRAGPTATSARQYKVEGGRVRVSGPTSSQSLIAVYLQDGSFVEVRGGVLSPHAAGIGVTSYCVVPPYALLGLRVDEALVVQLQVTIMHGGKEEWLTVARRRLTARDAAVDWSVRVPTGARYRAVWSRVEERDGAWRQVGVGVHEVAGPEAVVATTGGAK